MRVNDVHSQLNESELAKVVAVDSLDAIRAAVAGTDLPVAIAGGRHAMGGQQFCAGGLLLDTTPLTRVLDFDRKTGLLRARIHRIVQTATGASPDEVGEALGAAGGEAKVAIVSLLAGIDAETARARLREANGNVRLALG